MPARPPFRQVGAEARQARCADALCAPLYSNTKPEPCLLQGMQNFLKFFWEGRREAARRGAPSPSASSPSPSFCCAKCHLSQRERQGRECVPKRLRIQNASRPTSGAASVSHLAYGSKPHRPLGSPSERLPPAGGRCRRQATERVQAIGPVLCLQKIWPVRMHGPCETLFATEATAACGGNREPRLGQRPAGCEAPLRGRSRR